MEDEMDIDFKMNLVTEKSKPDGKKTKVPGLFHVYLICDITGSMGNQIEGVRRMVASYCEIHYAAQASRIKMHIVTYTENSIGSYVSHYSPSVEDLEKEESRSKVPEKNQIKKFLGMVNKSDKTSVSTDDRQDDSKPKVDEKRRQNRYQQLASNFANYAREIELGTPPHCPDVYASGGDGPENLLYALATAARTLPPEDTAIFFVITDADPHFRTLSKGLSSEAKLERRALREISFRKYDAFAILNRIVQDSNIVVVPILYDGQSVLGKYFFNQAAAISGGCLLRSKRGADSATLARGLSVITEGIYGNLMKYKVQVEGEQDGFEVIDPSDDSGVFSSVTEEDVNALDNAFHFTDSTSALSIILKREPFESRKVKNRAKGGLLTPEHLRMAYIRPPPLDSSITEDDLPASAGLGGLFAECAGVMTSIKKSLLDLGIDKYSEYDLGTVSFQNISPVVENGFRFPLPNLTDSRLIAKDGRRLYTVRPKSPSKVAFVPADELFVIVGNETAGLDANEYQTITLADYLKNLQEKYGKLVLSKNDTDGELGAKDDFIMVEDVSDELKTSLFHSLLDKKVTVRYQTTFIPVEDTEKAAMEFGCELYNHSGQDRSSTPRNLIVLSTTQGTALQPVDETGKVQKLFHHLAKSEDRCGQYGYSKHWLEVERTTHQVGGEQKENQQEKEDALKRGKAVAKVIGPKSIGKRFNCLMTLQIPLEQDGGNNFQKEFRNDGFCDEWKVYEADISDDDLSICEEDDEADISHDDLSICEEDEIIPSPLTNTALRSMDSGLLRSMDSGSKLDGCMSMEAKMCSSTSKYFKKKKKKASFRAPKSSSDIKCAASPPPPFGAPASTMSPFGVPLESSSALFGTFSASTSGSFSFGAAAPAPVAPTPQSLSPGAESNHSVPTRNSKSRQSGITNAPVNNQASCQDSNSTNIDLATSIYRAAKLEKAEGKANAARVSIGSKYSGGFSSSSPNNALPSKTFRRSNTERIMCTVVLFYTVAGGVPSTADVKRAIDDLEELYKKSEIE